MSTTTRPAPVPPEAPQPGPDGTGGTGGAGGVVGRAPDDGGLRRLVGIVRGLMGTQAATAVLGLAFWTLATRQFTRESVGVAGAAVALMGLLASLGTLGLGTVLIARLPRTPQGRRRVLVRTSLAVAAVVAAVLAVVVPLVVVHVAGADNLRPVAGTPGPALLFALGTALMAAAMVLDQAVLVVGTGGLQLERNTLASAVKVAVLAGLAAVGAGGGMSIFAAWTVGTLVSLPWVALRSRGGRALQDEVGRRLVDLGAMRGLGRLAVSHHALNTTLQAPLLLLPLLVTVLVSAAANGVFTTALQLTALVFALPFAISISLFAAADGDARAVVANMRRTLPFGLALSLAAYLAVFPLAPLLLSIFGPEYAEQGVGVLRLLTLAGLPFVIKDHYVALARVRGRTGRATAVLVGFLPLEVAAAAVGAALGGTEALVSGWLVVLALEAVVLGVSMLRTVRELRQEEGIAGAGGAESLTGAVVGARSSADPADPATAPVLGPDLAPAAAGVGLLPAGGAHDRDGASGPGGVGGLEGLDGMARAQAARARPGTGPGTGDRDGASGLRTAGSPAARLLAPLVAAGPVGPVLVAASLGLLAMSLGARAGREQVVGAAPVALWVTGLLLVVVPAAWAVLSPGTPRAQRLVVALAVPVVLQLSRTVLHPLAFAFHDELIHATVLRQILDTGHLFSVNSLLPITGFYPGTEVATAAVVSLTGLGPHAAAQVVLVAARLVLALGIVALVERVTGSTRIAATASVVYALNPQFLFFNSQYSYQTFALPMAVLAIHLVLTRRGPVGAWDVASARQEGQRFVALDVLRGALLPLAVIAAVVLSHHVTTVLLVIALAAWSLVDRLRQGPEGQWRALAVLSALTAAGLGATLLVPGNTLASYLGSIAESSGQQVEALLGTGKAKPLFANSAGITSAPWEQVAIVVAVLVITAATALALLRARAWWGRRRSVAVLLALVACLWPLTPAGHLTRATAEVGDRAAGFSFVGVALVVSWWLWTRRPGPDDVIGVDVTVPDDPAEPGGPVVVDRVGTGRPAAALTAAVVGAVLVGSVVFGSGPLAGQLPGPFRVSADARSVDPDNLAAAAWLDDNAAPGTRVYADRVGGLLAAADGGVFTVRNISTNIDASRLLLDPELTRADLALIARARIDYVVADRRDANGLPNQDVYVENGEFGQAGRTAPVPLAALRKFDQVRGAQRVYDNGSVAIYDVRGLRGAR